jgi:TP901 family phage tail tape measure protein
VSLIRSVGINFVVRNLGQYKSAMTTVRQQTTFLSSESLTMENAMRRGGAAAAAFGVALASPQRMVMNLGMSIRNLGRDIRSMGNEMASIGFRLGFLLSLPILSGVAATANAAIDFETAIFKMMTIVGLAESQVRHFGDEILKMAARVGRAPEELANALFFLTSAGIRETSLALDILERSAKLAAIGLGETKNISETLSAVIQAYGAENITAAKAGDVLLATIKEGKIEAPKLAQTLGRVIGIAPLLRIEFEELAAFVAAFSRVAPVEIAVTSLRGAMTSLLKPTAEARKTMAEYGFSIEEVRAAIADPSIGFTKTLTQMANAMQGNAEAMARVFGNVRGLAGVAFVTTEQFQESFQNITNAIAEADGITERGFALLTQTVGFQLEQLKAQFQSTAIVIGNIFLPVISDIVFRLRPVIAAIASLAQINPQLFKLAATFGVVLASLAPLMIFFGLLISSLGSIIRLVGGAILTFGFLASPLGVLIGIVGTLAGLFAASLPKTIEKTGLEFNRLTAIIDRVKNAFRVFGGEVQKASTEQAAQFAQDSTFIANSAEHMAAAIADSSGQAAQDLVNNLTAAGQLVPDMFDDIAGASGEGLRRLPVEIRDAGELSRQQMERAVDQIIAEGKQLPDGLLDAAAETKQAGDQGFGQVAQEAQSWGRNIVIQFARGIAQATIAVVRALTQVGLAIQRVLRGRSPPPLLPDLDKWGAGALTTYMEGWLKGDFSVFNDVAKIIERNLRTLTEDLLPEVDFAPVLIGMRNTLAEIINEFNEFGKVSQATLDSITTSFGPLGSKVQDYIRTLFELKNAQQEVKAAQEALNDVQQKFADRLKPIDDALDAIDRFAQSVRDAQRLEQLQAIIDDPRAPQLAKDLALMEMQQIELRKQKQAIEDLRDAEVGEAQEALTAAEAQEQALKDQLEVLEAFIDAQLDNNELLSQQIKLLDGLGDSLKDAADKIAKAAGDFGGLGDFFQPGDEDDFFGGLTDIFGEDFLSSIEEARLGVEGIFADILKEFEGIGGELDKLTDVWSDNFTIIIGKGQEFRDFMRDDFPVIMKNFADDVKENAKKAAKAMAEFIRPLQPGLESLGENLGSLAESMERLAKALGTRFEIGGAGVARFLATIVGTTFRAALAGTITGLANLVETLTWIVDTVTNLVGELGEPWDNMRNAASEAIDALITLDIPRFQKALVEFRNNIIQYVGTLVGGIIALVAGLAVSVIHMTIGFVLGAIDALFGTALVEAYDELREKTSEWISDNWESLKEWAAESWEIFTGWVADTEGSIIAWAKETNDTFNNWAGGVWDTFKNWASNTWKVFTDWVDDLHEKWRRWRRISGRRFELWADEVWDTMENWARDVDERIGQWKDDTIQKFVEWKDDVLETVGEWVEDSKEKLSTWASDITGEGGLIDRWIPDFVKKFFQMGSDMLEGLIDALTDPDTWNGLWTALLGLLSTIAANISQWWNDLWGGLSIPGIGGGAGVGHNIMAPTSNAPDPLAPDGNGRALAATTIGPNIINNDMDMNTFEARVTRAVRNAVAT